MARHKSVKTVSCFILLLFNFSSQRLVPINKLSSNIYMKYRIHSPKDDNTTLHDLFKRKIILEVYDIFRILLVGDSIKRFFQGDITHFSGTFNFICTYVCVLRYKYFYACV